MRKTKRMTTKRKLFIHIGMHKTGTSSIQYAMHRNHDILLQNGYLYPLTGRHPLAYVQHDLFFRALASAPPAGGVFAIAETVDPEVLFRALLQEISLTNCNSVILSAENFWLLQSSEISRLGEWLADFEILPIIFIRRFSDFADSLHLTRVRIDPDYAKMFAARQDFYADYADLDLVRCVNDWAQLSTSGQVALCSYDNLNNDSLRTFLRVVGLGAVTFRETGMRYNESQSIISEAIRTACGRHGVSEEHSNWLTKQIGRLNFRGKHTLIPPAERAKLDEVYLAQVNKLLKSKKVKPIEVERWQLTREEPLVHLDGLLSIMFEIGRALAEDNPLKA